MRNPVRKMIGMVVVGIMAAAFVGVASPAGAQTTEPSCTFSVVPATFAAGTTFPQNVTVSGSASPDGATITVFLNGSPTSPTTTVVSGAFSVVVTIPASGTTVTVGITFTNGDAYTGACATPEGLPSVIVSAEQVQAAQAAQAAQVAALAFTGSSNTPSYVLIGLAALVVGAVLVVAGRRRSHVS